MRLVGFLTSDDMRDGNNSAFRLASANGHAEVVEILAPFLTVKDMGEDDNYAFRMACANGHVEVVLKQGNGLLHTLRAGSYVLRAK